LVNYPQRLMTFTDDEPLSTLDALPSESSGYNKETLHPDTIKFQLSKWKREVFSAKNFEDEV
jgi:hypothetical protein